MHDSGRGRPARDARLDAADAALDAPDAPLDAGSALCPPWQQRPPGGHGWLYVRALSSSGVPLTAGINQADLYVRRPDAPLPGTRADADDPCAVASVDRTTAKVRVLAAAIGFNTQEREFSPQDCLERTPCSVELPPRLARSYYRSGPDRVTLKRAQDIPAAERDQFAAAVAQDALARSQALHHPLAEELDKAARATHVPAMDLAIRYTESKLRKTCDARCLDEPSLEPAVRTYLRSGGRRRLDPFKLRTAPERWRQP